MIDQVHPADLDAWLAAQGGGGGVLLDVREAAELRAANIAPQGFERVAIPMNEIPQRLAELDAHRPVACLCHHGARSLRVAMFLERSGFERVANIAGGIDAWSCERDPGVPRY